jgi:hypothetical protein
MDDYKTHIKLPILARENHESWFRKAKLQCQSKDVWHTVEITVEEYAWISNVKGATRTPSSSGVDTPQDDDVSKLSTKFEQLGGVFNSEKQTKYVKDQATALLIFSNGLGEDDEPIIEEYETAKNVWTQLKLKYEKTNESTANHYLGRLQDFSFDENTRIDVS